VRTLLSRRNFIKASVAATGLQLPAWRTSSLTGAQPARSAESVFMGVALSTPKCGHRLSVLLAAVLAMALDELPMPRLVRRRKCQRHHRRHRGFRGPQSPAAEGRAQAK